MPSYDAIKLTLSASNDKQETSDGFFMPVLGLSKITRTERDGLQKLVEIFQGHPAASIRQPIINRNDITEELIRDIEEGGFAFVVNAPDDIADTKMIYFASKRAPGRFIQVHTSTGRGTLEILDTKVIDITRLLPN